MDENLVTLLEELSFRASISEDETNQYSNCTNASKDKATSDYTSSSNLSSPSSDHHLHNSQLTERDAELESAVNTLFNELSSTNPIGTKHLANASPGYDRSKLLVALLGNIDLVTCAIKKINQLVTVGKKMEQIYRRFYANPTTNLDIDEMENLIAAFSQVYNSESYVREVNVSRVYQAYCQKLIDICEARKRHQIESTEDDMVLDE